MDEALILAIALTSVAVVAFALLAWVFWHGAGLFLLAGRSASDAERAADLRPLGRRMAVVLLVGCALMATLAVFLAAELARNAAVATVASFANNVTFIAFIVSVVWFFVVQRPSVDKDADGGKPSLRSASLDHLHAATIVFVVCLLAVVGIVGIVAAGA